MMTPKPCPFCGQKSKEEGCGKFFIYHDEDCYLYEEIGLCGLMRYECLSGCEEKVKKWNTRAEKDV